MKDEIVLYKPNEQFQLEVQLKDETVWLNMSQIAMLFDRDRTVISRHIRNIYKEGELNENITCAKFAHMGMDADQIYETTYYNLDVIISVGYRVKSKRGVEFRQWANKVLKDYLLKGYAVNQRLVAIEDRMNLRLQEHADQIHELQNKVDFFVRTSLPPTEGIFFDGQIFDAYTFVADLLRSAKTRIVLFDNYIDESVLNLLDKRSAGVTAIVYTKLIDAHLLTDIARHDAQYPHIDIVEFQKSHDRFLCIDDTVYHIGASLKDLGKRWFAFSRMEITTDKLLSKL